jgi:hypothetical protein
MGIFKLLRRSRQLEQLSVSLPWSPVQMKGRERTEKTENTEEGREKKKNQ